MDFLLQNKTLVIAGVLGVIFLVLLFFALGGQREGNPESVTGATQDLAANVLTSESTKDVQSASGVSIQLPPKWSPDEFSFFDVVMGEGKEVKKDSMVTVHYLGALTSGQKFDSSYDRNQPFEVQLGTGQVIKGWEEGLVGMKVGGRRTLIIPPALGYGDKPIGPIPPNSTLIFDVTLLGVK